MPKAETATLRTSFEVKRSNFLETLALPVTPNSFQVSFHKEILSNFYDQVCTIWQCDCPHQFFHSALAAVSLEKHPWVPVKSPTL